MCIGPRNYLDTADINPRGGIRKRASRFRIQTIKMRSSILLHPDRNEWMDIYPGYRHRVDPINIQNIYLICMNIGYQSRQRKDKVWKKPQLVFLPSFTLLWRRLHLGEMIDKRRFMLLQRGRSSLSLIQQSFIPGLAYTGWSWYLKEEWREVDGWKKETFSPSNHSSRIIKTLSFQMKWRTKKLRMEERKLISRREGLYGSISRRERMNSMKVFIPFSLFYSSTGK